MRARQPGLVRHMCRPWPSIAKSRKERASLRRYFQGMKCDNPAAEIVIRWPEGDEIVRCPEGMIE